MTTVRVEKRKRGKVEDKEGETRGDNSTGKGEKMWRQVKEGTG